MADDSLVAKKVGGEAVAFVGRLGGMSRRIILEGEPVCSGVGVSGSLAGFGSVKSVDSFRNSVVRMRSQYGFCPWQTPAIAFVTWGITSASIPSRYNISSCISRMSSWLRTTLRALSTTALVRETQILTLTKTWKISLEKYSWMTFWP